MKQINYKDAYENVMIANKMLDQEIERLQNIIKEVREYIEATKTSSNSTILPSGKISDVSYCLDALEDIEEILDKEKE